MLDTSDCIGHVAPNFHSNPIPYLLCLSNEVLKDVADEYMPEPTWFDAINAILPEAVDVCLHQLFFHSQRALYPMAIWRFTNTVIIIIFK